MLRCITFIALLCFGASCSARHSNKGEQFGSQLASQKGIILTNTWERTPTYNFGFSALTQDMTRGAAKGVMFNSQVAFDGLPQTAGHEEVYYTCSGCHTLEIVMQQRARKERWRELLVWMTEKQGMAELYPDEEEVILSYLTREFGL